MGHSISISVHNGYIIIRLIAASSITSSVMIVRRHLTSRLHVLVCINPVLRWTAEGKSGLVFHQKQSSID